MTDPESMSRAYTCGLATALDLLDSKKDPLEDERSISNRLVSSQSYLAPMLDAELSYDFQSVREADCVFTANMDSGSPRISAKTPHRAHQSAKNTVTAEAAGIEGLRRQATVWGHLSGQRGLHGLFLRRPLHAFFRH